MNAKVPGNSGVENLKAASAGARVRNHAKARAAYTPAAATFCVSDPYLR